MFFFWLPAIAPVSSGGVALQTRKSVEERQQQRRRERLTVTHGGKRGTERQRQKQRDTDQDRTAIRPGWSCFRDGHGRTTRNENTTRLGRTSGVCGRTGGRTGGIYPVQTPNIQNHCKKKCDSNINGPCRFHVHQELSIFP